MRIRRAGHEVAGALPREPTCSVAQIQLVRGSVIGHHHISLAIAVDVTHRHTERTCRAGHEVAGGSLFQTQIVLRPWCDSAWSVYKCAHFRGPHPSNGWARLGHIL